MPALLLAQLLLLLLRPPEPVLGLRVDIENRLFRHVNIKMTKDYRSR